MKIGILGGGYVGRALGLHWKKCYSNDQVLITTRDPEKIEELAHFCTIPYLITSSSLLDFLQTLDALVVCLAPDNSSNYVDTYLKTAQQILFHLPNCPLLKQIVYTGSTSVYGEWNGEWVNEDSPLHPIHPNGQILCETERIFLEGITEHRKVCIFRLGEIYGPGREIEERLKKMQGIYFPGNGENYTNLIHLSQIVKGIEYALKHNLQGIYNLCNDLHEKRKDFYNKICKHYHLPPVLWDPLKTSIHGGNKRVSNEKIKKKGFTFDD